MTFGYSKETMDQHEQNEKDKLLKRVASLETELNRASSSAIKDVNDIHSYVEQIKKLERKIEKLEALNVKANKVIALYADVCLHSAVNEYLEAAKELDDGRS